jgi:CRISPR/Cas system-associated exonuclease Cas4 (RecB family)
MIKNLSPSRASQFKTCPKQFKFANVDKLKEPTNEVQAKGTTVHQALETYLTYLKKTGILKNSIIYFVKHGRK